MLKTTSLEKGNGECTLDHSTRILLTDFQEGISTFFQWKSCYYSHFTHRANRNADLFGRKTGKNRLGWKPMLPRAGSVCCPQMLAMYQHLTEQKKGTNTTGKKKGKEAKAFHTDVSSLSVATRKKKPGSFTWNLIAMVRVYKLLLRTIIWCHCK